MNPTYWWWIATASLVALELASGTFYLLMLALGTAAGGLVQLAGGSSTGAVATAACVAVAATASWHLRRYRHPRSAPYAENRDVMLDIGATVTIPAWSADGTARVRYRGADWAARWAGGGAPRPGRCTITALDGNTLLLAATTDASAST